MTDDILCRSVPFELRSGDDDERDGLTLDGYGAVFGSPTRIDSWEGTFDEEIARGLRHAAGFLRRELGRRVRIHHTPELHFTFDASVERGLAEVFARSARCNQQQTQ
mgnify:CR=1 FL=1